MSRRLARAVLPLALLSVVLTGCTEPAGIPPAEPSAEIQPLFASDEEALAAATAAYEEYLAVVDRALAAPVVDLEALQDVASGDVLDEARNSVASFQENGIRITGSRTLTEVSLQQISDLGTSVEVWIYLCESVEGVDVLDAAGNSLVGDGRPDLTPFEVLVVADGAKSLVSERLTWTGGGVCAN